MDAMCALKMQEVQGNGCYVCFKDATLRSGTEGHLE